MQRIIVFDSDPAGLGCHERGNLERIGLWNWMVKEWVSGAIVVIPAIIDYEVRRSLILAESWDGVRRLDDLYTRYVRELPISPNAMKRAAELWAGARREGRPTAGDKTIDGDVILAAQALEFCSDSDDWMIVTENVDHVARYVGHRARSRRMVVEGWMKSSKSSLP